MRTRKRLFILVLVTLFFLLLPLFYPLTPRVANDFPYIFEEEISGRFGIPQTWAGVNVFGENVTPLLWSWVSNIFFGLLNALGANFWLYERLFVLVVLLIGVFSIIQFLKQQGVGRSGQFCGALFYLTSSYYLLLLDGGQLLVAGAYSIFPLAFIFLDKALATYSNRDSFFAAIAVSALGFFDIRFVYVLGIVALVKVVFELYLFGIKSWPTCIKCCLKVGIWVSAIFVLIHFYWILPFMLSGGGNYSFLPKTAPDSQTTLGHAILFLQPHWYQNIFGQINLLMASFIVFPILAFLAPVLLPKSKKIAFWTCVALLGVFLSKGNLAPFGRVYEFFYHFLPGFSLFRDSSKFYFVTALAYAVLIGAVIDWLSRKTAGVYVLRHSVSWVILAFVVYTVFLIRPVWLGKMTGTFVSPKDLLHKIEIAKYIENDKNFGRVLWVSSRDVVGYASPAHPALEASRLFYTRPFSSGIVGSYELTNFIREAPYIAELLKIAAVKYISYLPPDTRRKVSGEDMEYYSLFSNQLSRLPFFERQVFSEPYNLFELKGNVSHFYAISNLWYVVGSERIYSDLVDKRINISQNGLIFLDKEGKILDFGKILLYKSRLEDLYGDLLKGSLYYPSVQLENVPNENGWWSISSDNLIGFRDFIQNKYSIDNLDFVGGYSIAETGAGSLTIPNRKDGILYVRALVSSKGGSLSVYQDDREMGSITTLSRSANPVIQKISGESSSQDQYFTYDDSEMHWFEVGEVSHVPITLVPDGLNVVDAISIVPVSTLEDVKEQVNKLMQKGRIVKWTDLDESSFVSAILPDVVYEQISSTEYDVTIKGSSAPFALVFSEGYDARWQLEGKGSIPLYGFVNGFVIERDGEYRLIYAPQEHVLFGLAVTGITTAVITGFLLYTFLNAKKPLKFSNNK